MVNVTIYGRHQSNLLLIYRRIHGVYEPPIAHRTGTAPCEGLPRGELGMWFMRDDFPDDIWWSHVFTSHWLVHCLGNLSGIMCIFFNGPLSKSTCLFNKDITGDEEFEWFSQQAGDATTNQRLQNGLRDITAQHGIPCVSDWNLVWSHSLLDTEVGCNPKSSLSIPWFSWLNLYTLW